MRLLNVSTRKLEEFFGDAIPKYAILSHTHMGRRRGFVQRSLGSSSAELSEAINSMFAWYKRSEACYAYLADVSSEAADDDELLVEEVKNSRWFTRGWTLQELLAPRRVYFYSVDWKCLADRRVTDLLSSITGIHPVWLNKMSIDNSDGVTIDQASVAERLSWASKRKTTREEDIAYCLLGIMDVNMPLLYGEGSKAFTRLQEEIIRRNGDPTILLGGFGMAWQEFMDIQMDDHNLKSAPWYGKVVLRRTWWKDMGQATATFSHDKQGPSNRAAYDFG